MKRQLSYYSTASCEILLILSRPLISLMLTYGFANQAISARHVKNALNIARSFVILAVRFPSLPLCYTCPSAEVNTKVIKDQEIDQSGKTTTSSLCAHARASAFPL